jgi:hypothetical protein
MIEQLDCILSRRATRPYICGSPSMKAYVLIYAYIRLNAISPTAISGDTRLISGHTKAEIYLCNTCVACIWSSPVAGLVVGHTSLIYKSRLSGSLFSRYLRLYTHTVLSISQHFGWLIDIILPLTMRSADLYILQSRILFIRDVPRKPVSPRIRPIASSISPYSISSYFANRYMQQQILISDSLG